MVKTFDRILQFRTGGSFELSGIRRLVFVANKADRVHEMDRGNLELLGIDATRQRVVGLIWFGYPAVTPAQTRREVESFLAERP